MVQGSLGFNNAQEHCDRLLCKIKIVKWDRNCFFRAISHLLAGTDELHTYIRLKVTQFIKNNETHIQNVEAYLKQSKMEQNSVWATENEMVAAARLVHRDIVVYSMYKINYRSSKKWLHYSASGNLDQPLNQCFYLDISQGSPFSHVISIQLLKDVMLLTFKEGNNTGSF